jgi:hypothetical protein
MPNERNFIEIRSEEVQEILGTPPSWLVQWGTTVALLGFALLLGVAWFVRYPDVVTSDKLSITTNEPPVEVVARSDGRVARLFVRDNQFVAEKQALALLQNTAKYEDVRLLDTLVNTWLEMNAEGLRQLAYPDSLRLGELQADYALFVRDLEDFQFGRTNRNNSVQSSIGSIQMQIKQLEQGIAFDQKSMKRLGEQLKIAEDFYERQKSLFRQGLISELKLEEERLKVADVERQRDLLEGGILEKNREIVRLRNSIQSENFGQQENTTSSSTRLFSSLSALRSSLDRWMLAYLLSAPIEGKVALNGLKSQQFVRMGEEVMTIVPQSHDSIIGQVQLPVEKSGKVATGQKVVMKLDNYPYQEFGTVTGKVMSKSLVPKNREYTIRIEGISVNQDGKMLTSTGKEITFGQQLLGTAEIVTEDKGFLQRVFEQLRASFY